MSDPDGPPAATYRFIVGDGAAAGHIPVPFDPRARFGRARPPVVVEIGGHAYRSTVAIMGGETFVPFRAAHRAAAGLSSGNEAEVTLRLDTAPREVAVPSDLAAAIAAAGVGPAWDRLSHSHRREHVEAIDLAKRPETRARRIAAATARLSAASDSR